jgi:peptide/nickel transport system substrate-binding protein
VQFKDNYSSFKPLLAQSWSNPDNSTWVFKLKPNVKFQNGKAFTSADVKHSYEASIDSYVGPYITPTIDSVTANDALTVTIKTKGPDPLLLNKLIYMFIVDNSVSPATAEKSTLLAFDGYHQGTPTTRKITYQYYKDDKALITAFNENKVDVAGDVLVNGNGTLPGYVNKNSRSIFVFNSFLGLNSKDTKSPLSKLAVRKAIYQSIDIDAYIKARNVVGTPSGQLVPKGVPGNDPAIKRPARDVTGAKKLLADAGYPKGFTVTFSHLDRVSQAAVDVLKSNLAEIGITVKPESYSDASTYYDKQAAGQLAFYADGLQTVFFDASDILTSALVPANYTNPEVDALMKQAATEFDPAKRLEILKTISNKIVDNVLLLPMYDREEIDLVRNNVQLETGTLISGLGAYLWNAYSD